MARCKQVRSELSARPSKAKFRPSPVQLLRQRDLEDKFARMRLAQSSPNNVTQPSSDKPPSAKQPAKKIKTSPNKQSSWQGGKNKHPNFEEYEHGYAPVVPPSMYRCLQEIVKCVKHLETHPDDLCVQADLESAECGIEVFADYFSDELPKDWKYDRATAGRWKEIPYFHINR